MLKKLKNSLVVLFLLGAIVLPLSQTNSLATTKSDSKSNIITACSGVPSDRHDIN